MASIRREVVIEVSPEHLWAAVRDVGALHTRLVAGHSRLVWTADFLPNELAPAISGMIEQGTLAMKKTLESAPRGA